MDSRANKSIFGAKGLKIIELFNLRLESSPDKCVTTADGKQQFVSGVVKIPIRIGNNCRLIEFLVAPTLECTMLLGSDFCRSFGISINFRDNTWGIGSEREVYRDPSVSNCFEVSDDLEKVILDWGYTERSIRRKK